MALISKQKYDPEQIQKLAQLVRIYRDKDQPFDYEIIVDGLRVVRRTSDPEMFFMFENFVTTDTKNIEILFYNGNSNVNEKRIFTFAEDTAEKGLSGIEVDARIQEQVDRQKKEWEYDRLKQENHDLKEEVEELEKEVERLEKEKQEIENNSSPLKGFLGEVGSSFVESLIRRNPKIVKNIPGGEALAGLLEPEGKKPEPGNSEESEVTFTPKAERTEDENYAIQFVAQLKSQFTREEFNKVLVVLEGMASDKSKIELILKHVNSNHHE